MCCTLRRIGLPCLVLVVATAIVVAIKTLSLPSRQPLNTWSDAQATIVLQHLNSGLSERVTEVRAVFHTDGELARLYVVVRLTSGDADGITSCALRELAADRQYEMVFAFPSQMGFDWWRAVPFRDHDVLYAAALDSRRVSQMCLLRQMPEGSWMYFSVSGPLDGLRSDVTSVLRGGRMRRYWLTGQQGELFEYSWRKGK
jgi:hypothetical protein